MTPCTRPIRTTRRRPLCSSTRTQRKYSRLLFTKQILKRGQRSLGRPWSRSKENSDERDIQTVLTRVNASMTGHQPNEQTPPGSGQPAISGSDAADKVPTDADPGVSTEPANSNKMTPEEQMALDEKELKEDDWGHQPC